MLLDRSSANRTAVKLGPSHGPIPELRCANAVSRQVQGSVRTPTQRNEQSHQRYDHRSRRPPQQSANQPHNHPNSAKTFPDLRRDQNIRPSVRSRATHRLSSAPVSGRFDSGRSLLASPASGGRPTTRCRSAASRPPRKHVALRRSHLTPSRPRAGRALRRSGSGPPTAAPGECAVPRTRSRAPDDRPERNGAMGLVLSGSASTERLRRTDR
jgi:hypothetical protein